MGMKKKRALVLLILAGILWGTSAIFVKYLTAYGITPIQLTAVRATVSAVIMSVFMLFRDRSKFSCAGKDIIIFLALAVTLFFSAFLYYTSMVRTSVCTAVILLNLHPVYVTVLSALIFRERPSRVKLLSIAAMLIGCAFVSGVFGGVEIDAIGILCGAFSGISYGCYILLVKFYNRRGISSTTANIYSFIFMAIGALLVCDPASLASVAISRPIPVLPLLVGIGIFTFVLPFVFNGVAMRDISASTASALGIMEPLSATLFSVLLFGEPIDVWQVIGVVTILTAVVVLGLDEGKGDGDALTDATQTKNIKEIKCTKNS